MVPVVFRTLKILVFLVLIPISLARPSSMLLDQLENTLLEVLSDVKHDEHGLPERNLHLQGNKRTHTDDKKTFTKEEIDTLEVNPNSNLEVLLETMLDNGNRAKGIHPDQKDSIKGIKLEEKHEIQDHSGKRNFIPKKQGFPNYWPNAEVPFLVDYKKFDGYMDAVDAETVFRSAIADFEKNTCLKLIRKSKQQLLDENIKQYVSVTTENDGCYADLGLQPKPQILNIGEGCLNKPTVLHEFCHAIGMQHEQSRSDRDKHVKVHFDNIETANKYNLDKEETLDNSPYDYYSIMQYELQAFTSKSWTKAISFVDPDLEFLAGLSKDLTFYDVMDITKAYQCNDHCKDNVTCINGGFINHKCECYCPEGLTGKYCDLIKSDTCGGVIELKPGNSVHITSPNYPAPYNIGEICYWLLRAENTKQRIVVEIEHFEIPSNGYNRCYHWLEIRYNLIGQPSYKLCDNKVSRKKITTSEYGDPDLMMLILDTKTVTGVEASRGFEIKAEVFEIDPYDECENPPQVDNADENSITVGLHIGAVVTYTCQKGYRMDGQNTIRCEGDGKWSARQFHCVEKEIVFEYDFNDGDKSLHGIKVESNTDSKWTVVEEEVDYSQNGNYDLHDDQHGNYDNQEAYDQQNSYDFFDPLMGQPDNNDSYGPPFGTVKNKYISTKTHGYDDSTYTTFTLPIHLESGSIYCLSFQFRRNTQTKTNHCAVLRIGDFKDRWIYVGCEKNNWKLFQGTYGPVEFNNFPIYFSATSTGDVENLNIDIDDIVVSKGTC